MHDDQNRAHDADRRHITALQSEVLSGEAELSSTLTAPIVPPSKSWTGPAVSWPAMSGSCVRRDVAILLAVALAFADASVVVLALPEIVTRLHVSISNVTWVIMAYNLALIVGAAAAIPFAGRLGPRAALVAGLALFGFASIGCGLCSSIALLVPFRCVQGLGGGLLLCASLPLLTRGVRSADAAVHRWSTSAAIGMAVGPALGGLITQIFDWRWIFLAQAPVATLAAVLVLILDVPAEPTVEAGNPQRARRSVLMANAGLTLLSAGLISALFLVVLLLIVVWRLMPITAAAVVTSIPLTAVVAERVGRRCSTEALVGVGASLVGLGLFGASLVTHPEVLWLTVTLGVIGVGLGLAVPSLTTIALGGGGAAAARAAKTVAARDGGVALGLLVLTPVFVHQLHQAPNQALATGSRAILAARISPSIEASLVPALLADYRDTPQGELPDFAGTFARETTHASSRERVALARLHRQLDSIVERAVTGAFGAPLRYGGFFALAVLPLLGLELTLRSHDSRRRDRD